MGMVDAVMIVSCRRDGQCKGSGRITQRASCSSICICRSFPSVRQTQLSVVAGVACVPTSLLEIGIACRHNGRIEHSSICLCLHLICHTCMPHMQFRGYSISLQLWSDEHMSVSNPQYSDVFRIFRHVCSVGTNQFESVVVVSRRDPSNCESQQKQRICRQPQLAQTLSEINNFLQKCSWNILAYQIEIRVSKTIQLAYKIIMLDFIHIPPRAEALTILYLLSHSWASSWASCCPLLSFLLNFAPSIKTID